MLATDELKIELAISNREPYLGDELTFDIVFKNVSDRDIEIWSPNRSSSVVLKIRSIDGSFSDGFSLTPMNVRYNEETRVTEYLADDNVRIILKPDELFSFSYTIRDYYISSFPRIGRYNIFIKEYYKRNDIHSNTLEVAIPLKEASFEKIITTMQNEKTSDEFLENMEELLKQFKPDFRYHSGFHEDLSDIEKAQNRDNIKQFLIWWEQNRGSSEVVERIAELNRKAGLEEGE